MSPPSGSETISGTERVGWDQPASNAGELATIRYAIYVDGVRAELGGVACGDTATTAGFSCTAPLPRMTAGSHTIELAAYVQDGSTLESTRSAALRVTVTGVTSDGDAQTVRVRAAAAGSAREWPAAAVRIARDLEQIADLAPLPDGRLLIAQRTGRIRVVRDGALEREPAVALDTDAGGAGAIIALAADPEFDRTRGVYAIYTSRARDGALTFTLARFRESGGTLGDRVVLLDGVRASANPRASLRFGADGKLYAAFDDGGWGENVVGDLGSFNGKILRLNRDGSTPDDQPRHSPVFRVASTSPRGVAWHRRSSELWIADAGHVGAIPWTPPPLAIASGGDALLVATENGLVRASIDADDPRRFVKSEALIRGVAVVAVAVDRDGHVYFATMDSVGSLRPDP